MSFIFDDKQLLNKLLEAGGSPIHKSAQMAEDDIRRSYEAWVKGLNQPSYIDKPDYNTYRNWYLQNQDAQKPLKISSDAIGAYNLAKKLVLGLRSQIVTNPNDPEYVKKNAPVDFDAAQPPEIKPENLETLGDFLTWTANNKIKWGGKRIAWAYNPGDPDARPPIPESGEKPDIAEPWVFQSYQKDRDRDPYTRQAVQKTYYANKDALLQLLTYLRDSETTKNNKVFEVMISKIIVQANQYLQPNEQIGARQSEKSVSPFKDTDLVDGFISSIMDPKNAYDGIQQYAPTFAGAPQKLTYGDIKDFASLQSWIGGMTGIDRKNPNDPTGNPCPLVHILYLRAKYLSNRADLDRLRPKYSDLSKIYLQNVINFGKQFQFDGKSCDVIGPDASQQPDQSGQSGQTSGTQTSGGTGKPGDPNTLRYLASDGPFNSNDISFDRITAWSNRYAQYQPQVQSSVAVILRLIQEAKMHYNAPGNSIPTGNLTYDTISMTSDSPRLFADHLWSIVYYTGTLYQTFFSENGNAIMSLPNGEELYRASQQQITGASPYADNIRVINELRADVRENIAKNTKR